VDRNNQHLPATIAMQKREIAKKLSRSSSTLFCIYCKAEGILDLGQHQRWCQAKKKVLAKRKGGGGITATKMRLLFSDTDDDSLEIDDEIAAGASSSEEVHADAASDAPRMQGGSSKTETSRMTVDEAKRAAISYCCLDSMLELEVLSFIKEANLSQMVADKLLKLIKSLVLGDEDLKEQAANLPTSIKILNSKLDETLAYNRTFGQGIYMDFATIEVSGGERSSRKKLNKR
jgi:hypothetical protein